ncbi:MAG TPA: prepilin-type N-terminal cleavage/methylation domain-containing protein [Xanthobacteraceae bacterium]|nr:prepilin-type N-terminal cleavage/methylation domain-containing protein [Xanthobacteraceae bacterium]
MKGRARGRHAREGGFNLVELLVALALFGLLTSLLFASIRFGMSAWTRGTATIDHADETLHAQNLLRSLVGNTYPLFILSGVGGHVDFAGTATSMRLLSPNPVALGIAGRSRFVVSAEPHGDRVDLRLSATPELAWAGASARPAATTLLAGAEKVEFSYLGMRSGDRAPVWVSAWNGQAALPQLVRVAIKFPQRDGRSWPELLVVPRITADVSCVYDPLTARCRGR